jgi:hypothetical protein
MKPIIKRSRRCTICYSPHRGDIEFLLKKNVSYLEVSKKYYKEFNITQGFFYKKLKTHMERKHAPLLLDDPKAPELPVVRDFNDYADRLLQTGLREDMMNPSKVSHSVVIAARRAQLEERKVQGMENAQKLMIMKFFRGQINGTPKLSGESSEQTDTD